MDDVREKIGEIRATAKAAHARLDDVETRISKQLDKVGSQLEELNAYMNRGKGWAGAMLLLSGIAGAGFFKLLTVFVSK